MPRALARSHAPRLARRERMDEILVAARDSFCEKGYAASSMADIAARVGVVEGALYKYFATKRELLLKVLEHWYEQMFGDYARDLAGLASRRAQLRQLIWRHLLAIHNFPLLCRLMFREVRSEADYHGSGLHAANRRYTQLLLDVIEHGVAAGEFRNDVPPTLLRDLIYGGAEHLSWNYVCGRGTLEIDRVADQLTALLCEGIAAPAASSLIPVPKPRRVK